MKAISNNGVVAVEPIVATKIETDATGGFAKIKQKYNLVASVLVMDCLIGDECYRANRHRALLKKGKWRFPLGQRKSTNIMAKSSSWFRCRQSLGLR